MRQGFCGNALGYLLLRVGSRKQVRSQEWGRTEQPVDTQETTNKATHTLTLQRTRSPADVVRHYPRVKRRTSLDHTPQPGGTTLTGLLHQSLPLLQTLHGHPSLPTTI